MYKKLCFIVTIVVVLALAACATPTVKPTDTSPLVIKEATPTPTLCQKKDAAKSGECMEIEMSGTTFQITNLPRVPQNKGTIVMIGFKKPGDTFWTPMEIQLDVIVNFRYPFGEILLVYDPNTGILRYEKIK